MGQSVCRLLVASVDQACSSPGLCSPSSPVFSSSVHLTSRVGARALALALALSWQRLADRRRPTPGA